MSATATPSPDDGHLGGRAACAARSAEVDRWLAGLLGDPGPGVCLVAVGSLGRRELCPASDLDLLLLHDKRRKDVAAVADRVWYPVWDAGTGLDHSVRTVDQALALAADDLKVGLGLLDARVVAGDAALGELLLERWLATWRKLGRRFLATLGDAVDARHRGAGDVAFVLEPDLKDGRGGLRDVDALRAAALADPVAGPAAADPKLQAAADLLLEVRVARHRVAGRGDHLRLQDQDAVAEALGRTSADALMADVYAAGRTIGWLADDTWRRVRSSVAGPTNRAGGDRPLAPGVVARDGEVVPAPGHAVDAALPLRLAAASAHEGLPLGRAAHAAIAAAPVPEEPWPEATRTALLSVLGAGPAAVGALEALDQLGWLGRALPEWQLVRSKPQRNAYHRFTVDRHLCEAVAAAGALTRRVARPDLLLLGAWLHDIGKGVAGRDHTEAGMEQLPVIGRRLGLPAADAAVLVRLVQHHLLLPEAATRRDLDDPATTLDVARAVGDRTTLELLAALAEADSLATGPSAWSPWKAGLLADLVERTERVLQAAGRRADRPSGPPLPDGVDLDHLPAVLASGDGDDLELVVVAEDRPGLLALVAGVVAVHGLDARAVDAGPGAEGLAVQRWRLSPAFGRAPDWAVVRADLAAAVEGRFPLGDRLEARTRAYRRRGAPVVAAARVLVDHAAASGDATVVEVRAADAVGLLHRLAAALGACGLDVRSARAQTMGHEAVDAFYVAPRGEGAVDWAAVEAALLAAAG